jgi:uncharacterized protein
MASHRHEDDIVTNESDNDHLTELIEARLRDPRRRALLKSGAGLAALSFLGGLSACGGSSSGGDAAPVAPATVAPASVEPPRATALGFTPVAKSVADTLVVAAGYSATVLYRLGDPIAAGVAAYRNDGTDPPASFAQRAGDHHDGMHFFGLDASGKYSATATDRGLLCINHEALTPLFLHPTGVTVVGGVRTVADEVTREMNAMGVSVIEVVKTAGVWSYKVDSPFNRRITTLTDMALSGPAARTPYMITKYSTDGSKTRGTLNNCANGYTPWGTYLTCEENWAGYFKRNTATDNPNRSAKELTALARYGVAGTGRELWSTVTPDTADNVYGRFIAEKLGASANGSDDYRNAPNTFGWTVEIDPFAPTSTPKKRTALGRFAHEGAWPAKVEAGKPIVYYQGCDSRNEYIYKYVSTQNWSAADATGGLAAGDKYLDDGKLYAAKFNADGTGEWIELRFGTGNITAANPTYAFADQADVFVHARLAADAAGATKMDRPEWGAVDPYTGAVYLTLTNSNATSRTLASTDAANPRHYNDPRTNGTAQRGNPNGHIIRWLESTPAATTFRWDVFLFGARAGTDANNINLSNLTAENDFSSPDGIWFGRNGICWVQTDDGAYTDVTNCMLLASLPGTVGDGFTRTITNTDAGGATKAVTTYVGAPLGVAKLRRFLVGPIDCEITGLAESPDGKALFVNIQHPGEETAAANIGNPAAFNSHWPEGGTARPRSATVVITKNDGGVIGV